MFATPAYAQAAGGDPPGFGAMLATSPIPMMILIVIIFYFLTIRPQQMRVKKHRAMVDAVKKNDTAITGGGLIGKVTKVEGDEVEIEIAQGVRVRALKSTLSDLRPYGAKPAND
jgi:preprotein translocase subunit YajC